MFRGRLASVKGFRTLKAMEVHFAPDVERKLNDLAAQSGRRAEESPDAADRVMAEIFDALRGLVSERKALSDEELPLVPPSPFAF